MFLKVILGLLENILCVILTGKRDTQTPGKIQLLQLSETVFLEEIGIWTSGLNKYDGPHCGEYASANPLRVWQKQKVEERRMCSPCLTVQPSLSFVLGAPSSQRCRCELQATPWASWLLGLQTTQLALLGLQTAESRAQTSQLHYCVNQHHLCIYLFCFLTEPWLTQKVGKTLLEIIVYHLTGLLRFLATSNKRNFISNKDL